MMHFFDFLTQSHGAESIMAIAPLVWAAIMAAASGAKAATSDKAKADAERRYQTETARWSPWTGLQSKMVADPSVTNALLQGGISGFSFGQGLENDKIAAALQQAELEAIKGGAPVVMESPEPRRGSGWSSLTRGYYPQRFE